jgi:hypothetical protein
VLCCAALWLCCIVCWFVVLSRFALCCPCVLCLVVGCLVMCCVVLCYFFSCLSLCCALLRCALLCSLPCVVFCCVVCCLDSLCVVSDPFGRQQLKQDALVNIFFVSEPLGLCHLRCLALSFPGIKSEACVFSTLSFVV